MTFLPSYQGDQGFALQAAKGSPAAAADFRTPLLEGILLPGRLLADDPLSTITRPMEGAYVDDVAATGSPMWVVRPRLIGALLYAALGSASVSGAGDPFTHTFTVGDFLPYLTSWGGLGGALFGSVADTKVERLTLESRAGGLLTCQVALIGLDGRFESGPQTVALELADPLEHSDGAGALLVGGTAAAELESIRIEIVTGVTRSDSLAGYRLLDGTIEVAVTTSQTVVNLALWNQAHYGSATPADGDPSSTDVYEPGGSPAGIDVTWMRSAGRSLRIALPRVAVTDPGASLVARGSGQLVAQEVRYRAYRPASGSAVTAVLMNDLASY